MILASEGLLLKLVLSYKWMRMPSILDIWHVMGAEVKLIHGFLSVQYEMCRTSIIRYIDSTIRRIGLQ